MRYDLVIFDNDGVLVDSEPISNRLLAAYLTELGHPTSYEDSIRDYMGSAMHRVHDLVLERTGRRLPEDFDEVFHARVFAAFERELRPVPGVTGVLEKLAAVRVLVPRASLQDTARPGSTGGSRTSGSSAPRTSGGASRRRTCSCTRPGGWAWPPGGAWSWRTPRWASRPPWRPGWTCTGSPR
jgi:beta-phosphoglucomutase-like phosphatase (HAD superfamily)